MEDVLHVVQVFQHVQQLLHPRGVVAGQCDGVFGTHRDLGHFGLEARSVQCVFDSLKAGRWRQHFNRAVVIGDHIVRARFERLRAWRRDRASEQHVPPYVIFQDKTLLEIAIAEPGDLNALEHISGVGQSKLDRYGKGVLEALGQAPG